MASMNQDSLKNSSVSRCDEVDSESFENRSAGVSGHTSSNGSAERLARRSSQLEDTEQFLKSIETLPLVIAPDPLLKKISNPVEKVDDELRIFMQKMVKTMYLEGGVGLAAVQVGVLQRIFVMDIDYETIEHDHHNHDHHHGSCGGIHVQNCQPQFFINPEIIEKSTDNSVFNEGCLSFPTLRNEVSRPKTIKLRFLDFEGKEQIKSFGDIAATCIQHEIDHLNGITFLDNLNPIRREMMLKKLQKLKKNGRI